MDKAVDSYCQYDKISLSGDFNFEMSEVCLDPFLYQHNLKNLVKVDTWFKSVTVRSRTYLFLTNQVFSFQNTINFATGLFEFYKLVLTVLKFFKEKTKAN